MHLNRSGGLANLAKEENLIENPHKLELGIIDARKQQTEKKSAESQIEPCRRDRKPPKINSKTGKTLK